MGELGFQKFGSNYGDPGNPIENDPDIGIQQQKSPEINCITKSCDFPQQKWKDRLTPKL
jgi:hypothetical protein